MSIDEALRRLASRQHGLVTTTQARQLGASRSELRTRTTNGAWNRLPSGVLRLEGSVATEEQRLMTAVLMAGAGAVLSHWSAAALWGIPGFDAGDVHVSRLRARTSRPTRTGWIHEPRSLPAHHLTRFRDLPVTTPSRTIFDLAGVASPGRVERAMETAWSRRLVSGKTLHAMLPELAERGRTGITLMRLLLAERAVDYRPMDSGTEVRAKAVLADAGIRGFDHQVDLGDDEDWLGRVDLVDRERRIVLEIDSELYHGALIDKRADEERAARLEAAGYLVVRVTDTDVWHHPQELVRKVRGARRTFPQNQRSGT